MKISENGQKPAEQRTHDRATGVHGRAHARQCVASGRAWWRTAVRPLHGRALGLGRE